MLRDWDMIVLLVIYCFAVLLTNVSFALYTQEQYNYNIQAIGNETLNSSLPFTENSQGLSFLSALTINTFSPVGFIGNIIFVVIPLGFLGVLFFRQIRHGGG